MDWNVEEVVNWLKEIGLSKYAKRFKGYLVNGAVLVQMDGTLLDDLEVTDPNDRKTLLDETAKLASTHSDKSQVLPNETQDMVHSAQVLDTPLITVSNFDDGENGQGLVLICDDDDLPSNGRKRSNDELINQRIVNLAYSDEEESTTDDRSERDFSFKDSEEEHDFNIYDEGKDSTVDSTPVASSVATRATQMVELLSRDNVALREKLESFYLKMNNMQMLECELESMRAAYEELQISFRKRESLEYSTRTRMESEINKLQESNRNLQAELDKCKDEVEQGKKSLEKSRSDLQLKNEVIRQLIAQNNSFASTRDDLEDTIKQQRQQIEEIGKDKNQLASSLVQGRESISYLQHELKKQQLHTNHVSPTSKAHVLHVTERRPAKEETCLTTNEKTTRHRHSNSADEGIAELDGPTSVPVLLEMLREKDERIQVLGENILRLEQTLLQEGTSRNLAIRAVSVPKEARIAALENSIQEREKIIAECRVQNLKSVEELYVANRRCADLEAIFQI